MNTIILSLTILTQVGELPTMLHTVDFEEESGRLYRGSLAGIEAVAVYPKPYSQC